VVTDQANLGVVELFPKGQTKGMPVATIRLKNVEFIGEARCDRKPPMLIVRDSQRGEYALQAVDSGDGHAVEEWSAMLTKAWRNSGDDGGGDGNADGAAVGNEDGAGVVSPDKVSPSRARVLTCSDQQRLLGARQRVTVK
jgi:hypothetical protein